MPPMASSITSSELRSKLEKWLPRECVLSDKSMEVCLRALKHTSASELNMDFMGKCGDAHLKSCLVGIIQLNYPELTSAGVVDRCVRAAAQNEVLKEIVTQQLELSESIILGADYLHANKQRSTHRLGTVFEALVGAIWLEFGPVACLSFVNEAYKVLLSKKGVPLIDFEIPDYISDLHELLTKNVGQGGHRVLDYYDWIQSKDSWSGCVRLKGAPAALSKGPVKGKTMQDCKHELCRQLLEDPTVIDWIKNFKETDNTRKVHTAQKESDNEDASSRLLKRPPHFEADEDSAIARGKKGIAEVQAPSLKVKVEATDKAASYGGNASKMAADGATHALHLNDAQSFVPVAKSALFETRVEADDVEQNVDADPTSKTNAQDSHSKNGSSNDEKADKTPFSDTLSSAMMKTQAE